LAEFDEITAAEDRTGRYVSTVFQWRFGSAGKHVKQLIDSGALGRPLVGICNTLWYRRQDYYDVPWRGKFATEVGGPTMTLGIHLTDLFLWLLGDWAEVHAITGTLDHDIEVEDVALTLVRFENGMMGSVSSSSVSPRQETYLRLDFQQATIECSALYRYGNQNWRFSLPDGVENEAARAAWDALQEDSPASHTRQLLELLDSMAANERPLVSGAEARRILEFSASLYKSAITGQPVRRGAIRPDDPFYQAMNGVIEKEEE
jgi:predicted dehydrogenase